MSKLGIFSVILYTENMLYNIKCSSHTHLSHYLLFFRTCISIKTLFQQLDIAI